MSKQFQFHPIFPLHGMMFPSSDVKIGDNNALNLAIRRTPEYKEYTIHQTLPVWNLVVDIKNASKVIVNGNEINLKSLEQNILKLNGAGKSDFDLRNINQIKSDYQIDQWPG
jgi:hypothetical protein